MLQTMTDFVKRRFEKHFEFNLCFQNWRKNVGWVIMKDFGHKKIHFPFFKIEFVEGIERWGSMRCLMKSDRVPSHRKQPLRGKFWDWTKNFGFFHSHSKPKNDLLLTQNCPYWQVWKSTIYDIKRCFHPSQQEYYVL